MLVQGLSAACRRLRASSRVHVVTPHLCECCAAFPISVDLVAHRTWAVRDNGRRCGSSRGQVFRLAAAARRAPIRRKSFIPLGALRVSANRGLCRRRREPETPRAVLLCRSSSKSNPSSAVSADELQRNREIFQFGEGVWLHPGPGWQRRSLRPRKRNRRREDSSERGYLLF